MTEKQKVARCRNCGKFIGYAEMDRGEVLFDFTPDTHFTAEKLEHEHKRCNKKPFGEAP